MSYDNPRISPTDSIQSMVIKMSDGNPGAINVMMAVLLETGSIDPDNILGGLGVILSLDAHDIYGSDIWCLFKDGCGQDMTTMVGALRAVQLGHLGINELKSMVERRDQSGIAALLPAVRKQLPNFAR